MTGKRRFNRKRGTGSVSSAVSRDMQAINQYPRKYNQSNQYQHQNPVQRTNTYSSSVMYGNPNMMNMGQGMMYNNAANNNNNNNLYNTPSHSSGSSFGNGGGGGGGSLYGGGGYNRKMKRRESNLIQPTTQSSWDPTHIRNETADMTLALTSLVGTENNKASQFEVFLSELKEMKAASEDTFCQLSNADRWSYKEVCYWLSTIHLEKYILSFQRQIIDGSILLQDLDEQMLTHELGIKRLHVKKLLREIKKLRGMCSKFQKPADKSRDALIESLRMEMDNLRRENQHLKSEVQRYKQQASNNNSAMFNNAQQALTSMNSAAHK